MLKMEGGVVFIDKDSMIRDVRLYDVIIVCVIPKDAEWNKEYANRWIEDHTDGEVHIAKAQIMNQHGYADMMKKKGELEAKIEQIGEKLKAEFENADKVVNKPTLYQRVTNKLFSRG